MAPATEGDAGVSSMQQYQAIHAQVNMTAQRRPRIASAPCSQRPVSAQAQLGYQFIPMSAVHIDPDDMFGSTPGSIKDAVDRWTPTMLHKARPKSASVTAAAWKAYGSPKLKGQIRNPPAPTPAHPKMLNGHGPDPLNSSVPTVGMLGGGFSYPCRASPRRPQSAQPVQQRAWSAGTRHAPAELQAWHAQQQARLQGSMHTDVMVPAAPQLVQPFSAAQLTDVDKHAIGTDQSRLPHTHPTDPSAHRAWCMMLQKSGISTTAAASARQRPISATTSQRPRSAGRALGAVLIGGAVSMVSGGTSTRLTSTRVGAVQQLGARYAPHTVAGHVRPQQEHVLPMSGDTNWAYSRVGATAMARLQASIKLPMSAATHTGSPGRPLSASSDLSHLTLAGGQVPAMQPSKRPMSAMPRSSTARRHEQGGPQNSVGDSWHGANLLAHQAELVQGLMEQEGLLVTEQQGGDVLPVLLEASESQEVLQGHSVPREHVEQEVEEQPPMQQDAGLQQVLEQGQQDIDMSLKQETGPQRVLEQHVAEQQAGLQQVSEQDTGLQWVVQNQVSQPHMGLLPVLEQRASEQYTGLQRGLEQPFLEQHTGLQHVLEQQVTEQHTRLQPPASSQNQLDDQGAWTPAGVVSHVTSWDHDTQAVRHDGVLNTTPFSKQPSSVQHESVKSTEEGLDGFPADVGVHVGTRRLSSSSSSHSQGSQRTLHRPFSARRPSSGHTEAVELQRRGSQSVLPPDGLHSITEAALARTESASSSELRSAGSVQHDRSGQLQGQDSSMRHQFSQASRTSSSNSSGSRSSQNSMQRPMSAFKSHGSTPLQGSQSVQPTVVFTAPSVDVTTHANSSTDAVPSPDGVRPQLNTFSPKLAALLQAGGTSQRQRSMQPSTLWQLGLADGPESAGARASFNDRVLGQGAADD